MGSARSVLAALGLPSFTACVLSQSTVLRLQVALQGNCLKQALGCLHFPGLSRSGSGSRVLHKGTDSAGPAFCALPRSEQLGWPSAWWALSPAGLGTLSPPLSQLLGFLGAQRECCLSCAVCLLWRADLWLWPSWWKSTIQDPRKTWLATGSLLAVWYRMPLSGSGHRPPASLPPARDGRVHYQLALLWYLLSPWFCEQSRQCLRLELFVEKFFLSLSLSLWLSLGLDCYLKLLPSDCP